MIKAVFFDFAGTLFSDRALRGVHLEQLRFVGATVGVAATDRQLRSAYRMGLANAFRRIGTQPRYRHRTLFEQAFAEMAATLGGVLDPAAAQTAVDRQYRSTVAHAELRPDVIDVLTTLRATGIGVALVSNIDDELFEPMLDRLTLRPHLDHVTSSEAADSCKPDRRIFEVALSKAGCNAGDVLFVGDSPIHDVAGPAALGMRTALLAADAAPELVDVQPDFVIRAVGEVPALLDEVRV